MEMSSGTMVIHYDSKTEAKHHRAAHTEPAPSSWQVQLIFVVTLLFIVLSVIVEFIQGDFVGLNVGEDFLLVLGRVAIFGAFVGIVAGALHEWSARARHR
jgi:hypothetical protein